jgi:hypothetical protein
VSQPISWKLVAERFGVALAELRRIERGTVSGKRRRVAEFDWVLLAADLLAKLSGLQAPASGSYVVIGARDLAASPHDVRFGASFGADRTLRTVYEPRESAQFLARALRHPRRLVDADERRKRDVRRVARQLG